MFRVVAETSELLQNQTHYATLIEDVLTYWGGAQASTCITKYKTAESLAISSALQLLNYTTYYNVTATTDYNLYDIQTDFKAMCADDACLNALNDLLQAISGTETSDSSLFGCNLLDIMYTSGLYIHFDQYLNNFIRDYTKQRHTGYRDLLVMTGAFIQQLIYLLTISQAGYKTILDASASPPHYETLYTDISAKLDVIPGKLEYYSDLCLAN